MPGFTIGSHPLEFFLLAVSLMMIFSVLSSKASSYLGVPSLLLFLGIGMFAGSEGPGGIDFTNYHLAYVLGSISLMFILFDGGMKTPWKKVKPVLKIGISFSTLGVIFTCVLVGSFVHFIFNQGWIESLLFGAIVSSTDAAAVFSILRSKNLSLKGSIKQVLEFEAGSNDPMAIFLTIGFLILSKDTGSNFQDFILLFLLQWGVGLIIGFLSGKSTVLLLNKIKIDYDSLYAILLVSLVVLTFSITTVLGGSGFLSVYIAGLIIGNSNILRKYSLSLFQDGIAWISQISLFLVLGLLVFPSHLFIVWKEGIILAFFMMIVARPVSVYLAAPLAPFNGKERLFISWVGLRGAAPIILAILPWSVNFPNAEYYFNLVFFMVLVSVLLQGVSIPWLAKKLELTEDLNNTEENNVAFLPKGFVTIKAYVKHNAPSIGTRVVDLNLPSGVLLTSLERKDRYMIPKGETVFEERDEIYILARPSNLDWLRQIFGSCTIID